MNPLGETVLKSPVCRWLSFAWRTAGEDEAARMTAGYHSNDEGLSLGTPAWRPALEVVRLAIKGPERADPQNRYATPKVARVFQVRLVE